MRQYIVDVARAIGEDQLVMVDDDLRFVYRPDSASTKLVQATLVDIRKMMDWMGRHLNLGHAMVGISARQGNNNLRANALNSRIIRMFGLNLTVIPEDIRFDRLQVMEDFDFQLQLLRRGFSTVNLFRWAQDQDMTGAPGGCSLYRTHALQDVSAKLLKLLHPEFVTLRQKDNKTGGSFGHRTEVTIAWKRAAASSHLKDE